jgi:hypothetical protein
MIIPLTQDKVAIVDEVGYAKAGHLKWSAHFNGTKWYAVRNDNGKIQKLHRFLMDAKPDEEVDHINGDGLDCSFSNMRICSLQQNRQNRLVPSGRSKYLGVYYDSWAKKWCAAVKKNGHTTKKRFATEEEAARARDKMAIEAFGEFAPLNFPKME